MGACIVNERIAYVCQALLTNCLHGKAAELPYSGFFFEDKNFHELAFPRYSRGKFSRIIMDCKEYLLKS